jgi:antitoxin (DNA-binding transcriptional repressor) of toxin-antitoxin stability system
MKRVSVRELRQNLRAWLRRVRDGEAFEVDPIAILEARGQIARRGDGTRFSVPTLRSPRSTEEILGELRGGKV